MILLGGIGAVAEAAVTPVSTSAGARFEAGVVTSATSELFSDEDEILFDEHLASTGGLEVFNDEGTLLALD